MILKELLREIPYLSFTGDKEDVISSVQVDSRKVNQGDLFICMKGETVDSHDFIEDVIDKGASTILVDKCLNLSKYSINTIRVQNTRLALSQIYSLFYGYSAEYMDIIGVTGTNGKTSVTHFLEQIYQLKGFKTGLIGTINHKIDKKVVESKNTTPMSNELQDMFSQMKEQNVEKVFMEVSSHGLKQGRVRGIPFKHAVLTNITQDHLDFHKTMEDYKNSKKILFESLGFGYKDKKFAVLNADDNSKDLFLEGIGAWVLTYGINNPADIQALNINSTRNGLQFDIKYKDELHRVHTKVLGYYNIYNLLSVISLCIADGWDIKETVELVSLLKPVKGRLEIVETNKPYTVIVDYAHTPDGVENALKSIPTSKGQRIITVLGCGGDRDKSKRPLMARAAEVYSDFVILTSDNPRTENPRDIIEDMMKGLRESKRYIIPDREEAIRKGLEMLKDNDILIILGKGHEEYQIIGREKHKFSDVEMVKKHTK